MTKEINEQIERAKQMPAPNVAAALCEALRLIAAEVDATGHITPKQMVDFVAGKLDELTP